MESLHDNMLIQAYLDAKEFQLSPEFIEIIKSEIHKRNLHHVFEI
ncbi:MULTISPECIES: sporulation histidine kinase inhibitor Sda [Bacillaceae]|uniref:Sporulation histidine kinase inhibitor Sda n=1 Tax=Evansella alkalicola TaxID=745819 RepID=A0ABS6JZE4_9BACI|nr:MULTISPECIES: sporulation histidine kinase inhibitor Sda [Bacillaceae]MBU9723592.1 sporulation histidine kinase inhibitor Sda [Bacillus alkalicola]